MPSISPAGLESPGESVIPLAVRAHPTSLDSSTSTTFRSLARTGHDISVRDSLLKQSVWDNAALIEEMTQAVDGWICDLRLLCIAVSSKDSDWTMGCMRIWKAAGRGAISVRGEVKIWEMEELEALDRWEAKEPCREWVLLYVDLGLATDMLDSDRLCVGSHSISLI